MGRIEVHGLGKYYKHYARPSARLVEWASLGRVARHARSWVLRDLSFDVEAGQAVGVVGANGAGKSTLLGLIKGTIVPSEGRVLAQGRVASLQLGLGFHPDFTGVENLFTGGALLGLEQAEVAQLRPAIEDFAEIGAAIEEPVRTYSSGMQLRLAFSLATALRPDILLIDEALSVGDAYFQSKCVSRIRAFRDEGTTLVLVSHDAAAVRTLCDRALLLEEGRLARDDSPLRVLEYYNAAAARRSLDYEIRQGGGDVAGRGSTRSGDRRAELVRVELLDAAGPAARFVVGGVLRIRLLGRARCALDAVTAGISICDRMGHEVFGTNTHHLGCDSPKLLEDQHFCADFELPAALGPGAYTVTAALHSGRIHLEGNYDWWDNVCAFEVVPGDEPAFVGTAHLPTRARLALFDGPVDDAEATRSDPRGRGGDGGR